MIALSASVERAKCVIHCIFALFPYAGTGLVFPKGFTKKIMTMLSKDDPEPAEEADDEEYESEGEHFRPGYLSPSKSGTFPLPGIITILAFGEAASSFCALMLSYCNCLSVRLNEMMV